MERYLIKVKEEKQREVIADLSKLTKVQSLRPLWYYIYVKNGDITYIESILKMAQNQGKISLWVKDKLNS